MKKIIKNPNWWRRRTSTERCFTIISLLAWMMLIGLTETAENCISTECKNTAEKILSKMDTAIKPCDNFYQFACGKFVKETKIPDDKDKVDIFFNLRNKVQKQLSDIMAEERPKTDSKYLHLPNTLYKACKNTAKIESLGVEPIKQVSNDLGGWPVVVGSSWDSDNSWTWQENVKKARRKGLIIDSMLTCSVTSDPNDDSKYIFDLDQATTGIHRDLLLKGFGDSIVSAYYDYMVDIAVLVGAEKEAAKKELRESLEFEMELAKISWSDITKAINISAQLNSRTIKQLQNSYPYVQWIDYLNGLLPEGITLDESEVTNLSIPSFYESLGKLLQNTDKRVVANYMMWRIHQASVPFLTKAFLEKKLKFDTAVSGKQKQEPREKECVDVVAGGQGDGNPWDTNDLKLVLGSLYVRKYFNQDTKAIVSEIADNIIAVFSEILDKVDWMDNETRQEAKRKLNLLTFDIGYIPELMDNKKLQKFYRKLEIDPDKYFESIRNITVLFRDYFFSKLRLSKKETKLYESASPTVVETFYTPDQNKIALPAAILQDPLFNPQRPEYINYGAIGSVIGDTLTIGFNQQGSHFDADGKITDWWQPYARKAFSEKAECIIKQYDNYTDKQTGLKINGANTQDYNNNDIGSVKESYLAYSRWVAKNGEEPKLPDLDYTPQQMFWIATAQRMCIKYRDEELKKWIATAPAAPNEFRILGPLSNSKDFSRDFQCPEGAPMNPVQKCEFW